MSYEELRERHYIHYTGSPGVIPWIYFQRRAWVHNHGKETEWYILAIL